MQVSTWGSPGSLALSCRAKTETSQHSSPPVCVHMCACFSQVLSHAGQHDHAPSWHLRSMRQGETRSLAVHTCQQSAHASTYPGSLLQSSPTTSTKCWLVGSRDSTSRLVSGVRTSSRLVGGVRTSSRLVGGVHTSSRLVGVVRTSSRLVGGVRTSSRLVGGVHTSRLVGGVRTSSRLVGGIHTSSRLVGGVRTSSRLVGGVRSSSRLVGGVRTSSNLVRGVHTSSRLVGGVQNSSRLVGGCWGLVGRWRRTMHVLAGSKRGGLWWGVAGHPCREQLAVECNGTLILFIETLQGSLLSAQKRRNLSRHVGTGSAGSQPLTSLRLQSWPQQAVSSGGTGPPDPTA